MAAAPSPASPRSLLLDSGVLPVLLHHPAITGDQGIFCRLLCTSRGLREAAQHTCTGLVAVTVRGAIGAEWLAKHAPCVGSLALDMRALRFLHDSRPQVEARLAKQLAAVEPQLCLSAFTSVQDGQVHLPLIKRLPVRTMTSLVFADDAKARARQEAKRRRKAGKPGPGGQRAAAAPPPQGLTQLALAVRRLSGLRCLAATAGRGTADYLLPHAAFLKRLTRLDLARVAAPNRAINAHLPKGLRELRLLVVPEQGPRPPQDAAPVKLDLSRCRALTRLELPASVLRPGERLPPHLAHLELRSVTTLEPLLAPSGPAASLRGLVLTSARPLLGSVCSRLSALRGLTALSMFELRYNATLPEGLADLRVQHLLSFLPEQLSGLRALSLLSFAHTPLSSVILAQLGGVPSLAAVHGGLQGDPEDSADLERTYGCLEAFWSCGAPLVGLTLTGCTLTPQHLVLLGQCQHLSQLSLSGCTGRLGPHWPLDAPYASLSNCIKGWTRLRSLAWLGGDQWSVDHTPAPDLAAPSPGAGGRGAEVGAAAGQELRDAAEAAVAAQAATWPKLMAAALACLAGLTSLRLAGWRLGAITRPLCGLTGLQHLSLTDCGLLDYDVTGLVSALTGLTALDLAGNWGMSHAPLAAVGRLLHLAELGLAGTDAVQMTQFKDWLREPRAVRVTWSAAASLHAAANALPPEPEEEQA